MSEIVEEHRETGRQNHRPNTRAQKTRIHGTSPDKLLHETRLLMRRELEHMKVRQMVEKKPLTQHDISTLDKFGKQLLNIKKTDVDNIKNHKWENVSSEALEKIVDEIITELKIREEAEEVYNESEG